MPYFYSTTKQKRPVKVDSRVIGYIDGNCFIKSVLGSRHRLRCPPAWAIDAYSFNNNIKPYVTIIVVVDKESGIEYSCSVATFDELKGTLDRGFGKQYFLTLNNWKVKDTSDKQLRLFGGDGLV